MNKAPLRLGATLMIFAAGTCAAQTVSDPTVTVGQPATSDMLHTDSKGRHLAPHDSFYLLEYVSAKTDKGVEGFEPGQEVHLVEVHRPTHTLIVSNGRAQVELSPSKLTNDMDVAALARAKDQAGQAKIASYVQAEEVAYQKYEKDAADATAKDLEHVNKEQAVQTTVGTATSADLPAQPTTDATNGTSAVNTGYYGENGYGYGSPYGYFGGGGSGTTVVVNRANGGSNGGGAKAPSAPAAPAAPPGKAAAPAAGGGGGAGKGEVKEVRESELWPPGSHRRRLSRG